MPAGSNRASSDFSIAGEGIVRLLDELVRRHGLPEKIAMDLRSVLLSLAGSRLPLGSWARWR
jgi:hypothetical protein